MEDIKSLHHGSTGYGVIDAIVHHRSLFGYQFNVDVDDEHVWIDLGSGRGDVLRYLNEISDGNPKIQIVGFEIDEHCVDESLRQLEPHPNVEVINDTFIVSAMRRSSARRFTNIMSSRKKIRMFINNDCYRLSDSCTNALRNSVSAQLSVMLNDVAPVGCIVVSLNPLSLDDWWDVKIVKLDTMKTFVSFDYDADRQYLLIYRYKRVANKRTRRVSRRNNVIDAFGGDYVDHELHFQQSP